MKTQSEKTDGAADVARGSKKKKRIIASATVIVAAAAVFAMWFFVLSPQARIKAEVKKLISHIEKMDSASVMKSFSEDYYDAAGLDKSGVRLVAETSFDYFNKIKVLPKRMTTFAEGRSGGAAISGTAIVFISDSPMKIDFVSEPVRLDFKREKGGWKIVSVSGLDRSVMEDIKSYMR
jgi:hypothetical protein